MILQTITIVFYFNILPCIYLINDDDLKASIAETSYYLNFLKLFHCENVHPKFLRRNDENENSSASSEN